MTALLWLDLETTGLAEPLAVLEVAVVIQVLETGAERAQSWLTGGEADLELMPPAVREMHESSGLLADLREGPCHSVEQADEEIAWRLPPGHDVYLAGSGVIEFDRPVMRDHLPLTHSMLHYRSLDLGVFRRMARMLGMRPPSGSPFGEPAHRAMPDVRQSMAQWEWFRGNLSLRGE